jgi:hypothetical protein
VDTHKVSIDTYLLAGALFILSFWAVLALLPH